MTAVLIKKRLDAIVDMVPDTKVAADIGCDHGKAAAGLIKRGKADSAICTDISAKSLEKAKKLAADENISGCVSFRHGDGFSVLEENEADTAVIAGMGGELIAAMLQKGGIKVPDTLVLSCNTMAAHLRKWLCDNGFRIEDEVLVHEGRHYYPVILARRGQAQILNDIELELGPVIMRKMPNELVSMLHRRIDAAKAVIKKAGSNEELTNKLSEQIKNYEEVIKCRQQ